MEHYEDIFSPMWIDFEGNWSEKTAKTRNYILNEMPQWTSHSITDNDGYVIFPKEFKGDEYSLPFAIKMRKINEENQWEISFGDINKQIKEEIYKWDIDDPYKDKKAVFLIKFMLYLSKEMENGSINKIIHHIHKGKIFRSDNSSYLYLIYNEMNNKEKFTFEKDSEKIEIYEQGNK